MLPTMLNTPEYVPLKGYEAKLNHNKFCLQLC